jgi:hypothetical protein
VSIRSASPNDLKQVLVLVEAMQNESPRLSRLTFNRDRAEALMQAALARSDARFATFVSEDEHGAITGFASGFADTHATSNEVVAVIPMFYVIPAVRSSIDAESLACVMKSWADKRGAIWIETGPWIDIDPKKTRELLELFGYQAMYQGMESYPPVDKALLHANEVSYFPANGGNLH